MDLSRALTLVAVVAFTFQFLIFLYLYPSSRERFFRYLLWAWGIFAVAKALKFVAASLPETEAHWAWAVLDGAGAAGFLFVFAAALALRRDYRIRAPHAAVGIAYVAVVGWLADLAGTRSGAGPLAGLLSSVPLALAGALLWGGNPKPGTGSRERFLAGALLIWGVQRVVAPFVVAPQGSVTFFVVHSSYMLCYFLAVFAIIIMVLDRARSETASLKEFNERLVDGLGEGLELVDGDYRIRHANRWMVEEFGRVVGRRCHEVLTGGARPCDGCPMERRGEMVEPRRLDVTGAGGRRLVLTCSPVRQPDGEVFLLELVADVTEYERLRARLGEAERLAAVGELAAGVAHEIRNPLAAIVNATSLLERDDLTGDERASTLGAVKKEARRLNGIVSEFLAFARPGEPRRAIGDIREVVDHVARLVREDRPRSAGVVTEVHVDPSVPPFAFDSDQLTQVLWNVVRNGIEAIDGPGRLRMDVVRENGHVAIAVSDTGPGILPEEQRRIFEPFYSRKRGGTGLGLAIVRRIVSAHGGRIEVESGRGTGTRFIIYLPLDTR
ncbi:MAG TPA: ATP-binding protein [Thermodesulfobacteriota bacterium]